MLAKGGVLTLLYFLADNMFSKSRLTPARIKVWISLLCVVTAWTLLTVRLLVAAQRLEAATRAAVISLNEELVSNACMFLRKYVSLGNKVGYRDASE